jgi:hypothetical protein
MTDSNDWLKVFSSHPFLWALGSLVVLYLLYRFISGTWNVFTLALGADGRLSTSKCQFLLWTAAVLYVFLVLLFDHGNASFSATLPQNILLVMGFSLTTAVGAKYIVITQPSTQPVGNAGAPTMAPLYLIADNNGLLDLNKAQMLAWTMVGIGAFLMDFGNGWSTYASCVPATGAAATSCFPDVPQALMVLMGLGQGAYLGGKIVPQNTAGQSS